MTCWERLAVSLLSERAREFCKRKGLLEHRFYMKKRQAGHNRKPHVAGARLRRTSLRRMLENFDPTSGRED